jgi:vacuolar protein sorting-associated protein 54
VTGQKPFSLLRQPTQPSHCRCEEEEQVSHLTNDRDTMSEYTSSPSRPASPVAALPPLPDIPTVRPLAYRFNWDPTSRRPGGPRSVSETTEGRGDYFSSTPKVDIYGASSSTAALPLATVPSQWSSAKHGFHGTFPRLLVRRRVHCKNRIIAPPFFAAISTVVNSPHKKSAPPKAHAAVPPVPRVELPRVRRKDFDPYLSAIGPEWGAFQRNIELSRADSAQLEESSMTDSFSETDSQRTPLPPKSLPPLSSVPEVFFKPDFDLGDPRTFDAVAEVPSTFASSSSHSSTSRSTSPAAPPDPSTLAHSLPLLEKLSHHADTIEQHLVHEIARRATPFFAALSNLQDLQAESARCLERVKDLRTQLGHVGEYGARRGLRGVHREIRLAHLRDVQSTVQAISGVIETVGIVRGLVDDGKWGAALDCVDQLQAMWDGPTAPVVTPTRAPSESPEGSLLPPVVEEELLDDEEEEAPPEEESAAAMPELEIPLSKLKAFAALPSQLQTLTQEITSSLTSDLVATLKIDLVERIHRTGPPSSDEADVRDRLHPLIEGLVRTKNLKESIAEWRGVVLGEVEGILQQVYFL